MSDITKKDAVKWLTNLRDDCGRYQDMWHYAEALEQIIKLLDADVVPVRYGEWIHPTEYGLNLPEHYCSECGTWEYSDTESKYCSNCGAKMDGDIDD